MAAADFHHLTRLAWAVVFLLLSNPYNSGITVSPALAHYGVKLCCLETLSLAPAELRGKSRKPVEGQLDDASGRVE